MRWREVAGPKALRGLPGIFNPNPGDLRVASKQNRARQSTPARLVYTGNASLLHGAFCGYSLYKFPQHLKRWITILILWPAKSVVVETPPVLECGD
jgi:hypothetical protein